MKNETRLTTDVEQLSEIRDEMLELLYQAQRLLKRRGGLTYERARSYWLAHIETALKNDHGFLGGSMVTMEDTLAELAENTRGSEER